VTRIADMTWVEYARLIDVESPVLIIPVGSTEQHGAHLPLSTDVILPEAVATRVAAGLGALVAPALSYGYKSQPKSGGGNHFRGTASLDGATLVAVLRDILNEFVRHGLRKIALFNGHMENDVFIVEAIDLALRDQRREGVNDLRLVKLGYWEFIDAETEKVLFEGAPFTWALEHAAIMETSVMLHLRPDLVRADRIAAQESARLPLYDLYPYDPASIPGQGALSSPASASAEKGEIVLRQIVPDIVAALREAFALSAAT
jgi:creatinine amidohydrolase